MNLLSSSVLMLLLLCLAFLCSVVFRVCVCLAIYSDSKSLGIKKYATNVILAAFFPVIVSIVYLCTRKDAQKIVPKLCVTCNTTVTNDTRVCPNCGNTMFVDYVMAGYKKNKKTAKIFTVLAIICCVASISLTASAISTISDSVEYYSKNPSSFFDEFDDKDDASDNDDLEEFFGGQNPFADFGY